MSLGPGALSIAGMGVTEQGRRLGIPPRELKRIALERALEDVGDGLGVPHFRPAGG